MRMIEDKRTPMLDYIVMAVNRKTIKRFRSLFLNHKLLCNATTIGMIPNQTFMGYYNAGVYY